MTGDHIYINAADLYAKKAESERKRKSVTKQKRAEENASIVTKTTPLLLVKLMLNTMASQSHMTWKIMFHWNIRIS